VKVPQTFASHLPPTGPHLLPYQDSVGQRAYGDLLPTAALLAIREEDHRMARAEHCADVGGTVSLHALSGNLFCVEGCAVRFVPISVKSREVHGVYTGAVCQ